MSHLGTGDSEKLPPSLGTFSYPEKIPSYWPNNDNPENATTSSYNLPTNTRFDRAANRWHFWKYQNNTAKAQFVED